MVVIGACVVLVVIAVVAVARWGDAELPAAPGDSALQRYVWHLAVAVASGLVAGILVAGAGGRLVMRLLALTSPASAQGRITEADQTVGKITTGGTIGFVIFTAIFFGIASGMAYALIRRLLPRGRLAGLTYGALLLVTVGTRIEPLRRDNEDFDLVGPSTLSLLAFGALVVLHGMTVAALAARYGRALPAPAADARVAVRYLPVLPLLMIVPVAAATLVGAAVAIAVDRSPAIRAQLESRTTFVAARLALVVAAVVCLPGSISTIVDIARRGP